MRAFILLILFTSTCLGASYYVDFSSGSDASDGSSTGTAWKHCPGDANATGTAALATLTAGDIVKFKGGVSYNGTPIVTKSGTPATPITLQSALDWGTGRAVVDGASGGTTNTIGIDVQGSNVVIAGFEIRNCSAYAVRLFLGTPNGCVVSNNVIYHIGQYPNDGLNYGGCGFGVYYRNASDLVVVSNLMYDLNESAVYPYGTSTTNLIVWGNEFTNIQDHAVIGGAYGYTLFAYNLIHDQTNALTHDDGIHYMRWGTGSSALIVAGNAFWNNNQALFLNGQATNGDVFIFNNRYLNTSSADHTGTDTSPTMIMVNTQEYPANRLWLFNNTFVLGNGGYGAYSMTARLVNDSVWTNQYLYNNLVYQSRWNENPWTSNVLNTASGYNLFTNNWVAGYLPGNVGLASFQASYPGLEASSVYGNVSFTSFNQSSLTTSDYHLAAGSAGIAQGTNLSTVLPSSTFNFLPAAYAIDPTKDAAGVQRGASWDIGAYAYGTNTAAVNWSRGIGSMGIGTR